jgi:hypothetical protein
MMPQLLVERQDKTNQKLFEYNIDGEDDASTTAFEDYMRRDYDYCESRSFCALVQEEYSIPPVSGDGWDWEARQMAWITA